MNEYFSSYVGNWIKNIWDVSNESTKYVAYCASFFTEKRRHSRRMVVMGKKSAWTRTLVRLPRFQLRVKGGPVRSSPITADSSGLRTRPSYPHNHFRVSTRVFPWQMLPFRWIWSSHLLAYRTTKYYDIMIVKCFRGFFKVHPDRITFSIRT